MKLIQMYGNMANKLNKANDLPKLFFRLILAYGFYGPAMMKWGNMNGIVDWFDSMGIPFPTLNAYLSATTEISGVVLLTLGLATRFITIPLMFTMLVAIGMVHLGNGFEAGSNGFEIPLYYLLMLFSLLIGGPGKLSLDYLFSKRIKK